MLLREQSKCLVRWAALWLIALMAAPAAADELVVAWNEAMLQAVRTTRLNPPRASRAFAMVHLAMFDAVNAFDHRYHGYAFHGRASRRASPEAAAAGAAHQLLVSLFPTQQASFDALLAQSLAGIDPTAAQSGIQIGKKSADAMMRLRKNDRSSKTVLYTPGSDPGDWMPTPVAFAPALLPQWPYVMPFAMPNGKAFRPYAPPALNSVDYAVAFEEVRMMGSVNSPYRSADQTEIALFWEDGPGTATPPGHWNSIAQDQAISHQLNLLECARLFALLNAATADAAICSWDAKYYYDHWRPVTGIPLADTDGNPLTDADPTWFPLLPTPPFPSYTSGHSTFSSASAAVLANFFGRDDIPFTSDRDLFPGTVRSFDSFSEAAAEAGQSRIYGGIHWQYDNQAALMAGAAIGDFVSEKLLQPLSRH